MKNLFALIKDKDGNFLPIYPEDHDRAAKVKIGDQVLVKSTNQRSIGFHRKFMALIKTGFENQEQYKDFDDFRYVMTMKAGYYHRVITDKGTLFLPQSVAFDAMDQETFEELFQRVGDVIANLIGVQSEDLMNEIQTFF